MESGGGSLETAGSGEGSVEFRLLMAYAQRRRPPGTRREPQPGGDAPPRSPGAPDRKRKKKKRPGKLRKLLMMCVRPQREGEEPKEENVREGEEPREATVREEEEPKEEPVRPDPVDVSGLADRLSSIVDSVDLHVDDIEPDGPDDVTEQIVELLRESGDQLNKKIKEDKVLAQHFCGFTYTTFAKIATRFIQDLAPPDVVPAAPSSEKVRIALACEVTRKLTAVDGHPMNTVMGFGAKYLQENFSPWVQQHGGWENAFGGKEDEEVE